MITSEIELSRTGAFTRRLAFGLAFAATATAVSVSVVAGWQRGGWLTERLLWVAIGTILVISAHLLPALCQSARAVLRIVTGGLWLMCLGATCYSHAVFFIEAQQHAGAVRAAAVAPAATVTLPAGRDLTAIAEDQAKTTADLAAAKAERCEKNCSGLRVRRASLAAQLDALNTEAAEAKRREALQDQQTALDDRTEAEQDAQRADPVTGRLAAVLHVPTARLDLLSGMAFALTLEGVACILWFLAFSPAPRPATEPRPAAVTANHAPVVAAEPIPDTEPAPEFDDSETPPEFGRLAREIAGGRIRPTVADIRKFLKCSQAKALALRRMFDEDPANKPAG